MGGRGGIKCHSPVIGRMRIGEFSSRNSPQSKVSLISLFFFFKYSFLNTFFKKDQINRCTRVNSQSGRQAYDVGNAKWDGSKNNVLEGSLLLPNPCPMQIGVLKNTEFGTLLLRVSLTSFGNFPRQCRVMWATVHGPTPRRLSGYRWKIALVIHYPSHCPSPEVRMCSITFWNASRGRVILRHMWSMGIGQTVRWGYGGERKEKDFHQIILKFFWTDTDRKEREEIWILF